MCRYRSTLISTYARFESRTPRTYITTSVTTIATIGMFSAHHTARLNGAMPSATNSTRSPEQHARQQRGSAATAFAGRSSVIAQRAAISTANAGGVRSDWYTTQ